MDCKAVAQWLSNRLDAHTTMNAAVLFELQDFGIEVEFKKDGRNRNYALLKAGDREAQLSLMTWDDLLQSHKHNSRMGFCILNTDKEDDRPTYYRYSDDKEITTFDRDGNPKVGKTTKFYAEVKFADQIPHFCGWLAGTAADKEMLQFSGGNLAIVLDRLITGSDGSTGLTGRGFSFSANVRHIAQHQTV